MKKIYTALLFSVALGLGLSSCNEDKVDFDHSIFENKEAQANAEAAKNDFDRWLDANYLAPYNVSFKYRFEDFESDITYNLVPADFDKSVALAKIVKHVWIDAYNEVAGPDFLRTYIPRTIHLVGSPAYDGAGTMVLGTAEGGMKITLYNVNDLSLDHIDINMLNTYYFKTMHHEFAHILHQRRNFDQAFTRITENGYVGSNWYIYTDPETGEVYGRSDKQAWQAGFVTPYAMSEAHEDFVENIANYVTHTQSYWDNMLEQAGAEGAALIQQKFTIVYNYMKETWGIDLDKLREAVLRRQTEVERLDLTLPEDASNETTNSNAE
ncbi:putative zinc-binding metallopeptidase [Bacteroides sp. Marseille-P3684]|uniref:zinc-binding metallopeptidase n=1 Tax=Bacteroides sp. Marseille-P3684 TaxID=2086579 RepID=UPI000D0B6588|nr:putative zinc-binding metallopeptidase [Bacteroides sp. Marseille-P3684]